MENIRTEAVESGSFVISSPSGATFRRPLHQFGMKPSMRAKPILPPGVAEVLASREAQARPTRGVCCRAPGCLGGAQKCPIQNEGLLTATLCVGGLVRVAALSTRGARDFYVSCLSGFGTGVRKGRPVPGDGDLGAVSEDVWTVAREVDCSGTLGASIEDRLDPKR